MAQDIADTHDITPHEALLGLVRTAAGRAAWMDTVVLAKLRRHVEAGGDPTDPPDALVPWLRQSRDERIAAMRTAKSAVDAGVMAALEKRLDLEGELVADVLVTVLDALDLDQDRRTFALAAAQAKLSGEPLPEAPVSAAPAVEEKPDLSVRYREFLDEHGLDDEDDDQEDDGDDDRAGA